MPIRDATGLDLAAIDDIYNHHVRTSTATFQVEPTTPEERRSWFAAHGPEHPVIVFEETGANTDGPRVMGTRIAGWASLDAYRSRDAYARTVEPTVYVRHDHLGRGVGTQLLAELVARARTLGHHALLAHVASEHEASLVLHRELGFVEVGRLREVGHKLGRWLDVTVLELVLRPAAP